MINFLSLPRDSLEPILEKYNITFESHSLFLETSNTPLPLAFETFPLSGSVLHVRGMSGLAVRCENLSLLLFQTRWFLGVHFLSKNNFFMYKLDHSNVDKRVKDLSKNFESRGQPEHPISRTPSFGKKKEEQDERDGEEKVCNNLKNIRGKWGTLGFEFCSCGPLLVLPVA